MPLSRAGSPFVFPDLPKMTYKGLPALIADALPDDFGNALIDAYLARKGIAKDEITALDRLAYMGKRGMGALEFKPVIGPNKPRSTAALKMNALVESARKAVRGNFDSEDSTSAALVNILQVGTSAGGARAKAVIAWNEATGEIRPGQFNVEDGFVHWLLKFDGIGADSELGAGSHYGRIEYAYYLMALKAGITMSDCRLLEENGRAHFMMVAPVAGRCTRRRRYRPQGGRLLLNRASKARQAKRVAFVELCCDYPDRTSRRIDAVTGH